MEESQHDNKISHLDYLDSPSVKGNAWLEGDIKNVVNRRFEDTMPNANALLNSGIVKRAKEIYQIYPTDLDASTAYGPHGYIPENPETDPEFQKRGLIAVSTSYHGGNPEYTGQEYRGRYYQDAGEIYYDKRLTGNIDDKRRQENKKEWEKLWYGEEYGTSGRHTEVHEPVHEFFDILRNTADHWKHIKYDGKPLIDVIAPCKGNSTTCSNRDRLWDYAAEHVSVYTHSNIPQSYTRIIRWYGNKTVNGKPNENYVNIFDKADSHASNEIDYAKFVIAAEFTSAIDQAAGAVLSAWETKDAHTPHKIPFKFGNNPITDYRHKVVNKKKVAIN